MMSRFPLVYFCLAFEVWSHRVGFGRTELPYLKVVWSTVHSPRTVVDDSSRVRGMCLRVWSNVEKVRELGVDVTRSATSDTTLVTTYSLEFLSGFRTVEER